ncbi:hypothetical protein [Caproiciproducens sp.]
MNLQNLQTNQSFKNYNNLCSVLDEPIKKCGKSRQLQIADWQRYFDYSKDGQKFIITEIYNDPKEKVDKRGHHSNKAKSENDKRHKNGGHKTSAISTYMTNELCEILECDVFLHSSESQIIIKNLKLINENYNDCVYHFDDNMYHTVDGEETYYYDYEKDFFLDYCNTIMNSYKRRLKTILQKLSAIPNVIVKNDYGITVIKDGINGSNYYDTEFIEDEATIKKISELESNLFIVYDVHESNEKWKIYTNKTKKDEFTNDFVKKVGTLLKRNDIINCYKTIYIEAPVGTDFSSIDNYIADVEESDKFDNDFVKAQEKFASKKLETLFNKKKFGNDLYNSDDILKSDIVNSCLGMVNYQGNIKKNKQTMMK